MWMFSLIQSPTLYHTPPTQIHCAIPEELMIRWCEFPGVQSRWHLKKPFKGVKPTSSYSWAGYGRRETLQLSLSGTLWDYMIFQYCKGQGSKGMPYGSQGHWSCRATLPLNCCKGIGDEKAIKTTLSFHSQKSGYPLSTACGSRAFWTCNFNKSWWSLGHESQHYHLLKNSMDNRLMDHINQSSWGKGNSNWTE